MTTRAILITVVLMAGCGGTTGGVDGGSDAVERDAAGQDVSEGDWGSVDQAPADVQGDTASPDSAPADEGGQDTSPADTAPPVDVARDMGQPDVPPADVPPVDMAPADMAPVCQCPSYACSQSTNGFPGVVGVNVRLVECRAPDSFSCESDRISFSCQGVNDSRPRCVLTDFGEEHCFRCAACDAELDFCHGDAQRLVTHIQACSLDGACVWEQVIVPCPNGCTTAKGRCD
jgi:hypothetical protein